MQKSTEGLNFTFTPYSLPLPNSTSASLSFSLALVERVECGALANVLTVLII